MTTLEQRVAAPHPPVMRKAQGHIDRLHLDSYINQGLSLTEMADNFGVSRQAVSLYLKTHKLSDHWKEKRRSVQQAQEKQEKIQQTKQTEKQHLIGSLLRSVIDQKIDATHDNAERFVYAHQMGCYDAKGVWFTPRETQVLVAYARAKEQGEALTIAQLAAVGNYKQPVRALQILNKAGLEPMCRGHTHKLTHEQKAMIQRTADMDVTHADIAYFLNIHAYHVGEIRGPRGKGKFHLNILRADLAYSYKQASQVYEAIDAGFTIDEAAQYAGVKTVIAEHAQRIRWYYEDEIKDLLRTLYPKRKIDKPYLEKI